MSTPDITQIILEQISKLDERTQSSIEKVSQKVEDLQMVITDYKALTQHVNAIQTTIDDHAIKIQENISWRDKIDGKIIGISVTVATIWGAIALVASYLYKFIP